MFGQMVGLVMGSELTLGEHMFSALRSVDAVLVGLASGDVGVDGELVVAARRLVDLAETACTRVAGVFAENRDFAQHGCTDLGSFLAANTHSRQSEGLVRRNHNNVLRLLPQFSMALCSGHVGIGHLKAVAGAVTSEREELAKKHQDVIVTSATALSVLQFSHFMNHWAALCDDELNDPAAGDERLIPKRTLSLSELSDGMWRLAGLLDPLSGETVRAAIEAALPKPSPGDVRTLTQRRHDALVDVCAESLTRSDRPIVGGERPNVTVHIEASTGLAYTPQLFFLSKISRDMMCCDATVTAVWLNTSGKPFDVGTPSSDVPVRNRRAVAARDLCCRYAGCGRPGRWTEIHHIRYRENGGLHDVDNLVTLRRFHHRQVHKRQLKLSWANDGLTLTIEWPNGNTINSPPAPTTSAA